MQTVSVRFFSFIAINKRLKEEAVKRSSRCEEVAICGCVDTCLEGDKLHPKFLAIFYKGAFFGK